MSSWGRIGASSVGIRSVGLSSVGRSEVSGYGFKMSVWTCVQIFCADMRTDVRVDVCTDICTDTAALMEYHAAMRIDMCMVLCTGVRIDIPEQPWHKP